MDPEFQVGDEVGAKRMANLATDERELFEESERLALALQGCRQKLAAAETEQAATDAQTKRKQLEHLPSKRQRDAEELDHLVGQLSEVYRGYADAWPKVLM